MTASDTAIHGDNGVITLQVQGTAEAVLARVESRVRARGLTVFARIDFSADARAVGLEMPATGMLLFGNPRAGTPVMLQAPGAAIDLPLKVLVAQAADGTVRLSFNSPDYLQRRHGIVAELLKNISAVEGIVREAVAA
jgi:uncharacterized protein (DUF302 family)